MLLILVTLLVPIIFYYYFVKPFNYWRDRGVPHASGVPFFGNALNLVLQRRTINDFVQDMYNAHPGKRYVGAYQFSKPVLFLRDVELIKKMIIRDADSFTDHQATSSGDLDPLWSRNLVASKGETWHNLRTMLSPSFTSSKMKMMFGLMNDCGDQYVQYFINQAANEEVQEMEVKQMFTRFTNDVIATCALGVKCDTMRDPENEFYLKGADATNFRGLRALKFILFPLFPRLMKWLKIKIINDDVGNFFRGIVRATIDVREEQNIHRPDMIQLMMDSRKKPGGEHLDLDDFTAQALIFYLAGFETTSVLMAFTAYELAVNPELQQRLQREIDEALDDNNGELTYEALMGMKYLDMFINETLRLWPPSPITDREVTKDYYLPAERPNEVGINLYKGDLLWIPIHAIHMDPEYFEEPEKFDPERFNDENKARSNNAFLAFGLGPRICIGSRFALMETKMLIVKLLRHFEIVPVAKTNIPMVLTPSQVSTYSKGGWWLGFKKRST